MISYKRVGVNPPLILHAATSGELRMRNGELKKRHLSRASSHLAVVESLPHMRETPLAYSPGDEPCNSGPYMYPNVSVGREALP